MTLRLRRWWAALAVMLIAVLLSGFSLAALDSPGGRRLLLDGLAGLPFEPSCDGRLGLWTALARGAGSGLPDTCFDALGDGPRSRALLGEIVRDRSRNAQTRLLAFRVLARGAPLDDGLVYALLLDPEGDPAFQLAVLERLAARPDGLRWAELAADIPFHGLDAWGTLFLYAAGEEGMEGEAAAALRFLGMPEGGERLVATGLGVSVEELRDPIWRASAPSAWSAALDRVPCQGRCGDSLLALLQAQRRSRGEDDVAPVGALGRGEEADPVDLLFDPDVAESARVHAHRIAGWVAIGSPWRQALRLQGALFPAGVDRSALGLTAQSSPTGGLAGAAWTPGWAALVASSLGRETGVPVRVRAVQEGVDVRIGGRVVRVTRCGWSPGDWDGTEPTSDAAALALLDAVGDSLRAGDAPLAALQAAAIPAGVALPGNGEAVRAFALEATGRPLDRAPVDRCREAWTTPLPL